MTAMSEARDKMLQLFYEAWQAESPLYNNGEVAHVEWDGVNNNSAPSQTAPWARVAVRHNNGFQDSLGTTGNRIFGRDGFIFIQVFAPNTSSQGLQLAESLSIIAVNAFEGKRTDNGVWFKNVRANEIGPRNEWYQFNVTVEFSYDETK